jgi:putative CocE/NonD family hydrolase
MVLLHPELRRRAVALWVLFGLFVLRVVGQLLVAAGAGDFLPPWEEWFSGAVPYPQLLASQLIIIFILAKVCLDFTRGHGFFVRPRHSLATPLLALGVVYLSVMVIRYAIRISLYPPERWTGGSIPIFFHWVLAGFVLVLSSYHRQNTRASRPATFRTRAAIIRVAAGRTAAGLVVVAALLLWIGYQLAPTMLARAIGARAAENAVRVERGVALETSDGVRLVADVYHPVRMTLTPTILVRIPFSRTLTNSLFATTVGRFWAERGYTVVIQGTRGRYESEGTHYPLIDERRDGLDTLAWLKDQPWFDGRLGMWGGSAFGYTQWVLADQLPTAQDGGRSALMIQISSTDFHRMFYPGGAFSLASALFWAVRSRGAEDETPGPGVLDRGFSGLPLVEADDRAVGDIAFFNDWVTHATRDAYWQAIDGDDRVAALRAPVLLMAGWFDPFLPGQLADFVRIRNEVRPDVAGATRLVIGPWGHAESVVLPGGLTNRNYRLESLAPSIPWFDRHLRSSGSSGQADAPIRLYVMGTNVWRDEQEWPLARARPTSWYLGSGGHANSATGDGRLAVDAPAGTEPPDTFASDPQHPVPTRGGAAIGFGAGVEPQHEVERRDDVLVYTSPPLGEDVEVTGPVSATLYVTTSAPATDFTAKLVDVHPDGTSYNVTDGILRRGYSPSPRPDANSATAIEIAMWPTSMVFRQGHRIRLQVAGSNFPRFDRHSNTEVPPATATTTIVATQAVYHGEQTPSRIVLPIVPRMR